MGITFVKRRLRAMRLISICYREWHDTPQEWSLDTVAFGQRMLIVGRNAAGKSRTLNVTAALARNVTGIQPPGGSGDYVATFDHDGHEYIYEMRYANAVVVNERIIIDGVPHLTRGENGIGKLTAEKIGRGKSIDFQISPSMLAAVAKRDSLQHSFIEPLFEWGNSLRHYRFGAISQETLAIFAPGGMPVDDRDQNAVVAVFREGVRLFGDDFVLSLKKDLLDVDYAIDAVELGAPLTILFPPGGAQPLSINVKESELSGITDQLSMSTGMFRVLALLIHVNFAQFKGSASSLLVDDIGEGLDFDRSCRLIELLRKKAATYNFQLVMSTNDKFVMNQVPLDEWTVLHRSRNVVHVRNQTNSSAAFDDFKFTGLSNFSFFEMNAVEMNYEGDSERGNA